jgi:hypothetical protein
MSMVRRISTVRFRNRAQVDDLIRKYSNGSWMPVGTNGCHQGTDNPATASPERPYPQGIWGYPEQPVRSRIPSQPTDQSAGQARTGTGAVRSRDCPDAPGHNSPGRALGLHDGMVRRGQRQPGAVIMSAGRAPRIASARDRDMAPRPRAHGGRVAAIETAGAASQIPADCNPEVYDEGFWSRGTPGSASSALPDPPALCRHLRCPGPGDGLARGRLWGTRGWWSKRRGG